jgi:hypothetical protein
MKSFVQFVLVGCALCAPAAADTVERCRRDALDQWYCPVEPLGTAVIDTLGRVVCAPGACVKPDGDSADWLCSSDPGGRAEITPAGPVCDGECRAPAATDCKKI